MTTKEDKNGWSEYEQFVLMEMKRHNEWLEKIDNRIGQIEIEIAVLKVKASMWGAAAGAISAAATGLLIYIQLGH